MGGNVFKDKYDTVRLTKEQYENVSLRFYIEISEFLENDYDGNWYKCEEIPSYKNKDSFGDMDVLYCNLFARENLISFLNEQGIPDEFISVNSNVVSFLYDPLGYGNFQVDLIYVDKSIFLSSLGYYSYNDLGNLRGRIAHALGFKLGHEGLSYIHRDGDRVCFEIPLSRDTKEIDKFLKFKDVEKFWADGPKDLFDIFEYVSSSEYFNPEIYLLHNRNHQARVRDKKRKTYMEFLKWCETLPEADYFPRLENKGFYRLYGISYFKREPQLIKNLKEDAENQRFKERFNGDVAMKATGLQGKILGEFMQEVKSKIPKDLVLSLEKETIEIIMRDLYNKWK